MKSTKSWLGCGSAALRSVAPPEMPWISAHQAAKEVFGLPDSPPYLPHLSLVYGNLPIGVKEEIASAPAVNLSFQVSRVHLYSVNGPPAGWRLVGAFSLRRFSRP